MQTIDHQAESELKGGLGVDRRICHISALKRWCVCFNRSGCCAGVDSFVVLRLFFQHATDRELTRGEQGHLGDAAAHRKGIL